MHHIVKSEVSTVNERINERIDALETNVNRRNDALNAKLDKCISAINMLTRERQATGRLEA